MGAAPPNQNEKNMGQGNEAQKNPRLVTAVFNGKVASIADHHWSKERSGHVRFR